MGEAWAERDREPGAVAAAAAPFSSPVAEDPSEPGNVGGGCYARFMGEACAGAGGQIEVTASAAALVDSVLAGARARAGNVGPPCSPDQMSEEWLVLETRLEAVTKAAAPLGSRLPRVRDPATARSMAHAMDALLCNITAGYGALEIAIGEGLDALEVGRRAMDLHVGYSNIGDYAREELGMSASTAAKKARLARALRDRPLVREAVRRGELTSRKAEIIVPVAVGDDQARWILRGKSETVRSLRVAVNAPPDPDDEEWKNLSAEIAPEQRPVLDEGLSLAGIAIGAASTTMQRVKAWSEEYLGSHPSPPDERADDVHFTSGEDIDSLKQWLEQQTRQWADLAAVRPLKAPRFSGEVDPWRIDAELKRLMEMRNRWDEVLGHVAMLFRQSHAWEPLGFTDFGHYCEERLGMAERTLGQRVALERALCRYPLLREALRERRISYEKARVIARHVQAEHPDELRPLIAMAQTMTCVALRRALQARSEEQMCARGIFTLSMPMHVAELLKDAFRALRAAAKRWLSLGECLMRMAAHFAETWKGHLKEVMTAHRRIRARDGHFCQAPGCSRPAAHAHHIEFRAQGGSDDPSNLVSLCAAHHLFGIHDGRMRVTGTAPDKLVWEFGLQRTPFPAELGTEETDPRDSSRCRNLSGFQTIRKPAAAAGSLQGNRLAR